MFGSFQVRHWADADTPILYLPRHVPKLYVVTLKFDLEGKCKITSAQKVATKGARRLGLADDTKHVESQQLRRRR